MAAGKFVIPVAERSRTGSQAQIAFLVDPEIQPALWNTLRYWEKERGITRYTVQISPPHKPRTTGKDSQNTKYRGLLRDIIDYSGESMDRVNHMMKRFMDQNDPEGFPAVQSIDGFADYASEADLNTRIMSRLIEWTLRFMADFDIPIRHHFDEATVPDSDEVIVVGAEDDD